jgi:signal transduction histidine kinase
MLSKIFDPFVTTKPKGSGLGLSICRGIADAHHATIYARNNATGRGAAVIVEFPALHNGGSPSTGHGSPDSLPLSSPINVAAPSKS